MGKKNLQASLNGSPHRTPHVTSLMCSIRLSETTLDEDDIIVGRHRGDALLVIRIDLMDSDAPLTIETKMKENGRSK